MGKALFGITREFVILIVPLAGFAFGKYLDDLETLRLTKFRDKSSLFGRELAPGEEPSWP